MLMLERRMRDAEDEEAREAARNAWEEEKKIIEQIKVCGFLFSTLISITDSTYKLIFIILCCIALLPSSIIRNTASIHHHVGT